MDLDSKEVSILHESDVSRFASSWNLIRSRTCSGIWLTTHGTLCTTLLQVISIVCSSTCIGNRSCASTDVQNGPSSPTPCKAMAEQRWRSLISNQCPDLLICGDLFCRISSGTSRLDLDRASTRELHRRGLFSSSKLLICNFRSQCKPC